MKKLYVARLKKEAVFLSEETSMPLLKREGNEFILEEDKWHKPTIDELVSIEEIGCEDDIPHGWREGALIYGIKEEMSATEFLNSSKEYNEYLTLRAKISAEDLKRLKELEAKFG